MHDATTYDDPAKLYRLLLRADEVAQALGIGRSMAYQMMSDGTLPVVRFGRAVRVPADALREWVAQRTEHAA